MTQIQDLQSHLQFQLSLLRLTTTHDAAADTSDSHSDAQEEEHVLSAINRIAQAMR
jgi:hypothetical protein